jgi:hypothetical protein
MEKIWINNWRSSVFSLGSGSTIIIISDRSLFGRSKIKIQFLTIALTLCKWNYIEVQEFLLRHNVVPSLGGATQLGIALGMLLSSKGGRRLLGFTDGSSLGILDGASLGIDGWAHHRFRVMLHLTFRATNLLWIHKQSTFESMFRSVFSIQRLKRES